MFSQARTHTLSVKGGNALLCPARVCQWQLHVPTYMAAIAESKWSNCKPGTGPESLFYGEKSVYCPLNSLVEETRTAVWVWFNVDDSMDSMD